MSNGEINGAPQEGANGQQPAAPAAEALAGLPEEFKWLAKEVTNARNEAARYRTERNDLRTRLDGAVTAEDFATAKTEWDGQVQAAKDALVRERIVTKHKLPEDLAELLKGDDEASLEEHAVKLAKYVPAEGAAPVEPVVPVVPTPPPLAPSGGREPKAPADDLSPEELLALAKRQF